MNIFIIGGIDFISRNIVDISLERGHKVTIFTRGKSPIPFEKNKIDQEAFDKLDISYFPGADVFPFNTRKTAVFSLDKIKKHLGYKSTPFNEWMPLTIDWYRKNVDASFGYKRRNEELATAAVWEEMIRSVKKNFSNKI